VLKDFLPYLIILERKNWQVSIWLNQKQIQKAFEKCAWDGEWFYRATKDNGERIGSKKKIRR